MGRRKHGLMRVSRAFAGDLIKKQTGSTKLIFGLEQLKLTEFKKILCGLDEKTFSYPVFI